MEDDEHGYAKPGEGRPRRGRFWVPLIALYSGMRLNEICQLYVEDIKTAGGVDFFDVRTSLDDGTRAGDKRLKTKNAQRQVPIHPELRRFGFLEYVAEMKNAGHPRLFPELQLCGSGTYSDNFQKFFSRFLRKIRGQNLADISFHWFRHTFRDGLREAHVSTEIANRLCGWEESVGMAGHYGRGPSLSVLCGAVSKVDYVGLRLDHLRVPTTDAA
jgi:integrase